MAGNSKHLVGIWRTVAAAALPPADLVRHSRVDQVITGDGRVRLDRSYGRLPLENLTTHDALSVRSDPTPVSDAASVQEQLQETSETVVEQSVTTADTVSVSMNDTFNGTNTEVSAAVNYGGINGNHGTSELAARTDHAHAGIYAPVHLTATAALDFGSIAAQTCAELTIAVAGAVPGDAVALGPPAALEAGLAATGFVSAADTVTVRLCNPTSGAIDPASATWRASVLR